MLDAGVGLVNSAINVDTLCWQMDIHHECLVFDNATLVTDI